MLFGHFNLLQATLENPGSLPIFENSKCSVNSLNYRIFFFFKDLKILHKSSWGNLATTGISPIFTNDPDFFFLGF